MGEIFSRPVGPRLPDIEEGLTNFVATAMSPTIPSPLPIELSQTENNELLKNLPSVEELRTGYDRAKAVCLDGTRIALLQDVIAWSTNLQRRQPVFWLYGAAGSGKSTVAATIAQRLYDVGHLGGSFFFSRDEAKRNDLDLVFGTIAAQLARRYRNTLVDDEICQAIRRNINLGKSTPDIQLQELIINPLWKWRRAGHDIATPVVIVLDALDECLENAKLASIICMALPQLPPNLKFLVTSRPHPDLQSVSQQRDSLVLPRDLNDEADIKTDISLFLRKRMSEISTSFSMPTSWPGPAFMDSLIERADGLFIWAATASDFIGAETDADPDYQLKLVLKSGKGAHITHLSGLYLQVLDEAFKGASDRLLNRFRTVIGAILVAKDPLTVIGLGQCLGLEDSIEAAGRSVLNTMRNLRSVITFPHATGDTIKPALETQTVRLVHPSFRDFLLDREQCQDKRFSVDAGAQHLLHTVQSLKLIQNYSTINICGLNIGLSNSEVDDLNERLYKFVPTALRYAVRFWADHLEQSPPSDQLYNLVRTFYLENFLFWLELSSLLDSADLAFPALSIAQTWLLELNDADTDLANLVDDCSRFLRAFSTPIRQSATHVYYTALPFTPLDSSLYKTYASKAPSSITVLAGIAGNWTSCLSVLEGHRAAVNAVAVDNEAQRIVSGSDDCTVRLWNGRTGVAIKGNRGTLLGHTKAVRAVAFSPDGKQIVSGSEDCMLRLWDAGTGKPIRQPFAGHTEWVNSVSFLPNGRSIISGSGDKSIRVWNPETGRETHPPLLGHQHWVNSVAVHSNGGQFVSGSEDNSVCLWDVEDMRLVWRPPILHTEGVNSVAFSAGGHLFVSASDSCVIVWDSQKTQALHELHHRRRGYAKAVAFSPFRNDIIYCFGKSIRVWDGITNHLPHAIYWGHNSGASCVTTSRDGEFIISGSRDNTLRIFSAGKAAEIPPDHADRITSLVVSPSRALVLSGSTDGCIQLREVAKGSHAPDRRHGKGGAILFVGFSPDGGRLLSASYVARAVPGEAPQKGGVIRLWDAKSGECIQNCRTSFLPDGFTSLSCNATLVIFSINGRHPKLWDFDKETKSSKRGRGGKGAAIEKMIVNGSNVGTLYPRAISYSGNFIAISSQTWGLRLCRVEDGCLIQDRLLPKESSDYVQFVKFSPDANRLVSSTKGRSFRLWDILRREQVGKDCVHESAITFINFGRDGAVVYSGTEDGSVHLWDAFTSDPITRLHQAHQGPVKSIDFGYNNPRLILSNSEGEALRWDVGEVAALAWRVSWSEEGPDRGWFKGKDGERMWYMPVENRGGQTLVLPEGYVITGSDAGRITILDCRTVFGRQSIMQETSV